MQQDISKAGDEAQRKYEEEHREGTQTESGFRASISSAMDAKCQKLNTPFTKHLAIVNPHNGITFLMEVMIVFKSMMLYILVK